MMRIKSIKQTSFTEFRNIGFAQLIVFLFSLIIQIGCTSSRISTSSEPREKEPVWYDFTIVNIYPHDPEAFTQGLLYRDGYLYESTGRRGSSTLRKVDLESGRIIQLLELDPEYFGEGLTDMENRLIQLTFTSGIGFVYDIRSFSLKKTFQYEGHGWGLANDRKRLIMSDGSAELRFLEPETFHESGRLTVTEHGRPVSHINEMVMVGDRLYANVLHTNHIVIIHPDTGEVEGRIDLDRLVSKVREKDGSVNVLNGVAYDEENDRLFVTGKLWPKLFEIRVSIRE